MNTAPNYKEQVIAYRMALTLAKSLLLQGIITAPEYTQIDTILAEKYGILSCTIFR